MKYLTRMFLLLVCVFGVSFSLWARKQYVCYYESSPVQTTEINILNMLDKHCHYTLRVYDHTGHLLYSKMDSLSAYEADVYSLHKYIGHEDRWGFVFVETDDDSFLLITAEYFADDVCISIDTIIEPIPPYDPEYWYWYGIYHVNLDPRQITGLIVMNPSWRSLEYMLRIYDADGTRLISRTYTLKPYQSAFFNLADLIGVGGEKWGVVDIRASHPIAIACEYYRRGGGRLEIDNVVDYYGKTRRRGGSY